MVFMFFRAETKATSFAGTTQILNRRLTPVLSYADLNKTLQDLFLKSIKEENALVLSAEHSLNQAFGNPIQWEHYKEMAIQLGQDYLHHSKEIFSLFALLADCRRSIAERLNQQDKPESYGMTFGKAMNVKPNAGSCSTGILPTGRYESFYEQLEQDYNLAYQKQSQAFYQIKGLTMQRIEHCLEDMLIYTIIDKRNHPEGPYFEIIHCRTTPEHYGLIAQKIEEEFNTYLSSESNESILDSVAKLAYYFNIAMPLERGSASVIEMLSQILLRNKGLTLLYQEKIPIDLKVYFLNSHAEFVQHFIKSHHPNPKPPAIIATGIFTEAPDNDENQLCCIM